MQPCPKCGHLCHVTTQLLLGLPIYVDDETEPVKEIDCPQCENRESLHTGFFEANLGKLKENQ